MQLIIHQFLRSPQMLMEVDPTNFKTSKCYLTLPVINHKNYSINPSDMKPYKPAYKHISSHLWIQTNELNFLLYIYSINCKPFTSILKALVYTKTINNNAHGYIRPRHKDLQTNQIFTHLCLFLSFMVFSINR